MSRHSTEPRLPSARLEAALPTGVLRFRADDRATWLAMRKSDVTASVIASLIGEHPYMTRLGLYALKTGQVADAEVEPVITETSVSLPPMLRGTVPPRTIGRPSRRSTKTEPKMRSSAPRAPRSRLRPSPRASADVISLTSRSQT